VPSGESSPRASGGDHQVGFGDPRTPRQKIKNRLFWNIEKTWRADGELGEDHGLAGLLVHYAAKERGEPIKDEVSTIERLQEYYVPDRPSHRTAAIRTSRIATPVPLSIYPASVFTVTHSEGSVARAHLSVRYRRCRHRLSLQASCFPLWRRNRRVVRVDPGPDRRGTHRRDGHRSGSGGSARWRRWAGTFELDSLPPGEYELTASLAGFETVRREIAPPAGCGAFAVAHACRGDS
jgi:hypothetical protein